MKSDSILYEVRRGVGVITLNRPDLMNAMDDQMVDALSEAVRLSESSRDVKALVLTGRGRAFCGGADLGRFLEDYETFIRGGKASEFYKRSLPELFYRFSKPLIVGVNGPAVGVGMTLMLACDIRIAAHSAYFSAPFVQIGLTPEFGSTFCLPRLVGYPKTMEWLLTGRKISSEEALANRLINQVVEDDVLLATVLGLAEKIGSLPEEVCAAVKRLVREGQESGLAECIEKEETAFRESQKRPVHYELVRRMLRK
ncbi:enoyl-CoA hydratase/isomerase family protein [Desulfatiglans anilini]|uniref:enoyl-CoA hydratase/isomerase family protein n=1 Tax=Desulfatiglans anilini TaxID=90728 RepID=UPI00068647E7|nr:enoyl-CoA hydratase/isomerase family protein [Desulfatiglans anilini]